MQRTKEYRFDFGFQQELKYEIPEILDINDRFYHTYIFGKTGVGKSTLMERMAFYDFSQGYSVIFIDPKGDSVKTLYHLSKDKSKIRYISIDNPICINPLNKKGYKLNDIISEFVQILDILITLTASNPESTVLMREIIGRALRGFDDEHKHLSYLVKFLLFEKDRQEHKNQYIIDKDLFDYWTEFDAKEKNNYPKNKDKIESAKRVASRLLEISDGSLKNVVNGENELYIEELLKSGQSLFVDLSKMSRNNRIYLSNLIIYSVVSYCDFGDNLKIPLFVYVDEFQTIVSKLFSEILAKGRSYKVGFTLAHHDFKEITPEMLSSVLGNADTTAVFRCGLDEAKKMSELFNTSAQDFVNLPKYNAWLRLGTDNIQIETYPPLFTGDITSIKLPKKEIFETAELYLLSDKWIYY